MQLTDKSTGLLFWYNQVHMLVVASVSFDLYALFHVCIACDAAHCS